MQWSTHPVREHPRRAVAASLAVVVCGLMVATSFKTPLTGVLTGLGAIVILLLTLNRFFLPSVFAIDASGITARWPMKTRSLPWSKIARFAHDDEGGFLFTRTHPSRWRADNGIPVRFGTLGTKAVAAIKAHLPERAA